jgi:hypothetical protein
VLNACDKALGSYVVKSKMQDDIIAKMNDRDAILNQQILDLKDENGSWYRNPAITSTAGLVVGIIVGGLLFKK